MFAFLAILVLLAVWYLNMFQRDDDTLQLNDTILSTVVSEVDQTSRLYEGVLLLSESFESSVWERLEVIYSEGDQVQFDYMFDIEDDRFDSVETDTTSSPTYIIGGAEIDVPSLDDASYMTGRPIKAIRVKIREKDDGIGDWTYTATVAVDAASKSGE
jgi:hypothetical protein